MAAIDGIYIGRSDKPEFIHLRLACGHGLITGDAATGKTVTVQGLAENFSDYGVPVFCIDVKGDLAGLAAPGQSKSWVENRSSRTCYPTHFRAYPVIFWDLFGEQGHPLRARVSDAKAPPIALLMGLTKSRADALDAIFKIADDERLSLLDLKDLRAWLAELASRPNSPKTRYGYVSEGAISSIQYSLLQLEQQLPDCCFGEPALRIADLMRTARDGRGYISVLAANHLPRSPRLYAAFMLFLLFVLSEELPLVDTNKPKLVLFFEEAHLLFRDISEAMRQKVEQVMRDVRSRGVGVYFTTQRPHELPVSFSREFGTQIHHALRWFTPVEQRALRAVTNALHHDPVIDTGQALTELGVGEALVSTFDLECCPSMVAHTFVKPPNSRVGPITSAERATIIAASPLLGTYEMVDDRESAYEILRKRAAASYSGPASATGAMEEAIERGALGGIRRPPRPR